MSTKTEMTDDKLAIELVEAAGGEYRAPFAGGYELVINGHYAEPEHLRELIHDDIFPVIQERGKWDEFCYLISQTVPVEDIGTLLTLPAQKLAEKCLEILKEE